MPERILSLDEWAAVVLPSLFDAALASGDRTPLPDILSDAFKVAKACVERSRKERQAAIDTRTIATAIEPVATHRDCSTGPRVITHQTTIWNKGDKALCNYCGKAAVFDGTRWKHE